MITETGLLVAAVPVVSIPSSIAAVPTADPASTQSDVENKEEKTAPSAVTVPSNFVESKKGTTTPSATERLAESKPAETAPAPASETKLENPSTPVEKHADRPKSDAGAAPCSADVAKSDAPTVVSAELVNLLEVKKETPATSESAKDEPKTVETGRSEMKTEQPLPVSPQTAQTAVSAPVEPISTAPTEAVEVNPVPDEKPEETIRTPSPAPIRRVPSLYSATVDTTTAIVESKEESKEEKLVEPAGESKDAPIAAAEKNDHDDLPAKTEPAPDAADTVEGKLEAPNPISRDPSSQSDDGPVIPDIAKLLGKSAPDVDDDKEPLSPINENGDGAENVAGNGNGNGKKKGKKGNGGGGGKGKKKR